MTIAIVKNKQVASLSEMHRLALKRIFDKQNITYDEETLLDVSLEHWPKKAVLEPEEKRQLKIITQALIDNEDGKFYWLKEEMIRHGIDYRKAYSVGL